MVKNCSCYNSMRAVVRWTRNQTTNWSGLNIIYVCTVPHNHIKAVFKIPCLGEINNFTLSTIVLRINIVQQYGRLKLITMEMEKLCTNTITRGGRTHFRAFLWINKHAFSRLQSILLLRVQYCCFLLAQLLLGANRLQECTSRDTRSV